MNRLALALAIFTIGCTKESPPSPPPSSTSTSTSTSTPTSTPTPTSTSTSTSTATLVGAPTSSTSATTIGPIGGARPLRTLHVPANPKPGEKFPLVLELHGYGADGPSQDNILGMQKLAESERFILAAPDGIQDGAGDHFWNATDNCCNFENRNVDDVAYLVSLVDEIDRTYGVDRTRVYAVGHSNGGAMAMRLACDVPEIFSAVVSIAGPGWQDESRCQPKKPVSVRHMHGTRDGLIYYDGGPMPSLAGHHPKTILPSAMNVARLFATRDGCDAAPVEIKERLDLDNAVPGDESHTVRWEHCKGNASVELVTMDHVGHMLWKPTDLFPKMTWEFLKAHPGGGR